MNLIAAIPTIGLSPLLGPLLDVLRECKVEARLYDNRKLPSELDFDVEKIHMPDVSIYAEWNDAMHWGWERDANVLILNDDIEMSPCTISSLRYGIETHSDYGLIGGFSGHPITLCEKLDVSPITPHAGRRDFTNWCFIARPSSWQPIDERYRVWYGDDDMILKIYSSGAKVGVMYGVGVRHDTSTTSRQLDWVHQAVKEDERLWTGG